MVERNERLSLQKVNELSSRSLDDLDGKQQMAVVRLLIILDLPLRWALVTKGHVPTGMSLKKCNW